MRAFAQLLGVAASLIAARLPAGEWVRAGLNTNQPVWGVRGGLLWAIPPGGFPAPGGPRGLLRVGYPNLTNGGYQLINFIAIEPIVRGKRGFSELEFSQLDQTRGKRLWATGSITNSAGRPGQNLAPGRLSHPAPGIQQLDVDLGVERFENGAHVRLVVSQRSDAPGEIQLVMHAEQDSAPLEYCILTATMGNKARTRLLWLKDEVVDSHKLYPDHKTDGFAPHRIYPLDRLGRTPQQDLLVAITTDEDNPAAVFPFAGNRAWHYGGYKLTQYWKKPQGTFRQDLHVAVNGRYTYWQSRQPIPGGVAFENFELRERFYEGQTFVFGLTPKTPDELGVVPARNPKR
jgi:hypothetical protein